MGELMILSLLVCYLLDRSIDLSIITKCKFLTKRINISMTYSHPPARKNTYSFSQNLRFVELIDRVLKIDPHLYG